MDRNKFKIILSAYALCVLLVMGVGLYFTLQPKKETTQQKPKEKPKEVCLQKNESAPILPTTQTPIQVQSKTLNITTTDGLVESFSQIDNQRLAVLLRRQLAEIEHPIVVKEESPRAEVNSVVEENQEEKSRTTARSSWRQPSLIKRTISEETQKYSEPERPVRVNKARALNIEAVEKLKAQIEKQSSIVQSIKSGATPCSECGHPICKNRMIPHKNSLKYDLVWACRQCNKIFQEVQGKPLGVPFFSEPEPNSGMEGVKRFEEKKESSYRYQSLILDDLKSQLERLEKNLETVPVIETESKPQQIQKIYVLSNREVEVVSEIESTDEVIVKTPQGKFITLKKRDIRETKEVATK